MMGVYSTHLMSLGFLVSVVKGIGSGVVAFMLLAVLGFLGDGFSKCGWVRVCGIGLCHAVWWC